MQDHNLNQKIATSYMDKLEHSDVEHEKLFITFSGAPGSGKTTLAKKLTRDLQAQYVRHDDIRLMIKNMGMNPYEMDMVPISKLIIDDIMTSRPNKLVILDASLDRTWEIYFEHVKQLNAKPCIIRFSVTKDLLIKRLRDRDGDDKLVKLIDVFVAQFEACKNAVTADIELAADYDYRQTLKKIKQLYNLA